jgi:hypothetical protein
MSQLYLKGVYYDTESGEFWYLNNSGSYEAISVGGSSVLSATVTLDNDQIKALPTTAVEIIAAPGIGKMIKLIAGQIRGDTWVAPYTNTEQSGLVLMNSDGWYLSSPMIAGVLGGDPSPRYDDFLIPNTAVSGVAHVSGYAFTGGDAIDLTENLPVQIKDDFNGSDYTGGNAANTLKVTVYYVVVDL